MANTLTPNMSLIVPGVGSEPGPTYAQDVNNDMAILDQHDHSSGSGVQINPSGININSALTFNNNLATGVAGVSLIAQGSTPGVGTIYESGNDLYYVDGIGNNVRITQSGAVSGTPGSIANLTAPASASYVSASSTFVWESDTNIAANMDIGSLVMRNLSPNSTFALTLAPPAALSNNYQITLPTLPSSQSFVTIDNSGNMGAPVVYPLVNAGIANNTITGAKLVNGTLTTTQINAAAGILGSQLSSTAGILGTQLANASPAQVGVNPTQLTSQSFAGNYFVSTSLISNFSTTSSSYVHVTGLDITMPVQSNSRPTFIYLCNGSFNLSAASTFAVFNVDIQIRVGGSTVIATNSFGQETSSLSIPLGSANCVDLNSSGGGSYSVWIRVSNAATIAMPSGATIIAVQV